MSVAEDIKAESAAHRHTQHEHQLFRVAAHQLPGVGRPFALRFAPLTFVVAVLAASLAGAVLL